MADPYTPIKSVDPGLDLCGGEATVPQDGVSLRTIAAEPSFFSGRRLLGHRDPEFGPAGMPPCDIVTTIDRKLIRYRNEFGNDKFELYEIDVDPGELINVANDGRHDAEVDRLSAALDALLGGSGSSRTVPTESQEPLEPVDAGS